MFVACVVEGSKPRWYDKYFGIYLVYISFYFFSCCAEGYYVEGLKRVIGDFFVAFIAYWSTRIICIKYNSINALVYTLLVLGVFDAIITVCQVFHITFFDSFLNTFQLIGYEAVLDWTDREMMGLAIPGIMSSPVVNGHFLLLTSILSLYLCGKKFNVIGIVCFIIIVVGSYFAQLRTSFYLAVIFSVLTIFMIIVLGKKSTISFILLVLLFCCCIFWGPYLYKLITIGSSRYADLGMDANGRDVIYKVTFDFIMLHPILGHYNTFVNDYKMYPHNFFLNAYLHAGIVGFLAIVVLAIKQIIISIKSLFIRSRQYSKSIIIFASIFGGLFGNGITHNISLENGDVMIWLVWGALICQIESKCREDKKIACNQFITE